MEKNDVQSGGQDPVPKQLFSSLIYSMGHLVLPLTAQLQHTPTQFTKHQGQERWITGSIWSGGLFSPPCCIPITLNLQLGEKMAWEIPWRHRVTSQTLCSLALGSCNWIIHNYLCMQRLWLIKSILVCLAESLQECKRVKNSLKKHHWEES